MNDGSDVNVESPLREAEDANEMNGHNLSTIVKELGVSGVTIEQIFDYGTLDEEGEESSTLRSTVIFYKWLPHSIKGCTYGHYLTCGSTISHVLLEVIMSLSESGSGIKLTSEVKRLKKFLEPMDNLLKTSIIYHAYNRTDIGDDVWQYSTFVSRDLKRKMIREFQENHVPFKVFGIHNRNYRPERHRKRSKVDLAIKSHDYTDFLVEMTKILSQQGTLKHMITHKLNQDDGVAESESNAGGEELNAYDNDHNHSDQESVEVRNGKKRRRSESPPITHEEALGRLRRDDEATGDEDDGDEGDAMHGTGNGNNSNGNSNNNNGVDAVHRDDMERTGEDSEHGNGNRNRHDSEERRDLDDDESGRNSVGYNEDGRSSVAEKEVAVDDRIRGDGGGDGEGDVEEEEEIIIEDETGTSSGGLTGTDNDNDEED